MSEGKSTVSKYDANAVMKNVTDKIKATFVELVPDEKWAEMVQAEINKFTETRKPRERWDTEKPSEFAVMCKELLEEIARENIKKYLKEKYDQKFDEQHQLIEDAVKELVVENADKMFANFVTQAARNAVYQMQNSVQ